MTLDYSDENGNVSGGESEDERRSHANEIPTTTESTTRTMAMTTATTASSHKEIEESTSATTTTTKAHSERPCDTDNGGCDHRCQMVIDEYDTDQRIQCSCHAGYKLDESDGRRCHGKREMRR